MYFFQSILFIFIIIISSFTIYRCICSNKNIHKKTAVLFYFIFIESMFIFFSNRTNIMFIVFLDFPCFLSYLLKRRREAFLLSIINIVYINMCFSFPWYYYLSYVLYFAIDCLLTYHRKDSCHIFFSIKAFLTSFLYFLYFEYRVIDIIYLIFIFLYFYGLLQITYYFLKNYEIKKNDDTLIFQIAHEVKNPIAVCKGYLDMLDTNDQNKVNKYIPIVKSEMNRALTIMDDFLSLKRLTVEKDIMDLVLLLEDVIATMNSILSDKNVNLGFSKVEDEILIDGDYDRLKQVFVNLIKNAYEANASEIKLSISIEKDKVQISITDNGEGISTNDLKKIGQLFYTTKPTGTGIGVNMSKEIIKLHQGTLKYESKLGKQTTATVFLPYYVTF